MTNPKKRTTMAVGRPTTAAPRSRGRLRSKAIRALRISTRRPPTRIRALRTATRARLAHQTQADLDQRASDRDQAAADRDLAEGLPADARSRDEHESSRSDRAKGALEREATAALRSQSSFERAGVAARRDETAKDA